MFSHLGSPSTGGLLSPTTRPDEPPGSRSSEGGKDASPQGHPLPDCSPFSSHSGWCIVTMAT